MANIQIRYKSLALDNSKTGLYVGYFFAAAFIAIAVCALLFFYPKAQRTYSALLERGVVTKAQITGYKTRHNSSSDNRSGNSSTKYAQFIFSDSSGGQHSGEIPASQVHNQSAVRIIYDSNDPSLFQAGSGVAQNDSTIILLISAVFGLFGGAVGMIVHRAVNKRGALLKHGLKTTGEIVGVEEYLDNGNLAKSSSQRRQRYISYSVIVQWQIPGSARIETTVSGPVSYRPISVPELKNKAATVIYLPENPAINMIDPELYKQFQ